VGWFFPSGASDTKRTTTKARSISVETLHRNECKVCPLNDADVNSPKMEPTGADDPLGYVLGEAPGKEEDKKARQFVGESGRFLRDYLPDDCDDFLRFNNCIRTKPPKNRDPAWQEIECCRPSIIRDIENTKPKAIFGFGNVPLRWALDVDKITLWRGRRIPVKIGNHVCWFFPMLHPSGVNRKRKYTRTGKLIKPDEEWVFERDLKKVIRNLDRLPKPVVEDVSKILDDIEIITGHSGPKDFNKVKKRLKEYAALPYTAVDIETATKETGEDFRKIRPYGEGAKILSVAIAGPNRSTAIALHHKETGWSKRLLGKVEHCLIQFLKKSKCVKAAHNLAFELEWFAFFYGWDVLRASEWADTMAQAYCLDERRGVLNLNALCLQHFGFKLKSFSDVDITNLDNEPLESVLLYNGLDSKYECKLYRKQQRLIEKKKLIQIYNEQVRRIPTMVLTQLIGLETDQKAVREEVKALENEINIIQQKIKKLKAVKKFEKRFKKKFNPGSPNDVISIFRDVLKRKEVKLNKKGKDDSGNVGGYSSKAEILKKIKHPLAKLVLQIRSATDNKSTYMDGIDKEGTEKDSGKHIWPDGLVHQNLNTMLTRTGRLSADHPNTQNWPIRDKKSKRIRRTIVPSKKHIFVKFDYGQIEFRVIGMASKDKRLCQAIEDRYDVHQEQAEKLAYRYPRIVGGKKSIKDKDVMKEFREETKGGFVFASVFGALPFSISENMKIPEKIIAEAQDEFFDDFPGVKTWQEKVIKDYYRKGYVECLTGRRRYAPLERNKIINTPIQGTASDIVVDSMNRLSEIAQEEDLWCLQARLNIHDDLSFYIPINDADVYLTTVIDEMLAVDYDFINVPISVEVSVGPNWYELKELGEFYSDD